MKNKIVAVLALTLVAVFNSPLATAFAQGTAFTYQGRLNASGAPVSGSYDLVFTLYTTNTAGSAIAGPVTNSAVAVTNGLFTTLVDFGPGGFTSTSNWLAIAVSTNAANAFSTLAPRQQLTPVPYAITAANISGTIASASLSGTYGSAVMLTNAGNSINGSFTGNGASVTNVNAAALNGLNATNFWQLGGNNVTTGQFLGSTNNQPVEVRVNGGRALRLESGVNGNGAPNVIGGSPVNFVVAGVVGAVIGGGGATNYGGPSYTNTVATDFGAIGGGAQNFIQINALASYLGGGYSNSIQSGAYQSYLGGGNGNSIQSGAFESYLGGGIGNSIQSGSYESVLIGGYGNSIQPNNWNSFLGGGDLNFIQPYAEYSVLVGGAENSIQTNAYFSVLGGGLGNSIQLNATNSVLGGGYNNSIQTNAYNSFLGGGGGNIISAASGSGSGYSIIDGGFQNTLVGDFSSIGGGQNNFISGGNATTIGGGSGNANSGHLSTIGGGAYNVITNATFGAATIAGGQNNTNNAPYATIGGGTGNWAQPAAYGATISGGANNQATNQYASVPGGNLNLAGGKYSLAAGQQAQAVNQGTFVWADSQNAPFASTANDQFLIRAQGGVGINMKNNPDNLQTASLYAQGANSNGWPNSVVWFQNTASATNNAPALRVVNTSANATNTDGALSVSIQGQGLIAEFGNSGAFVVTITNNGTVYATAFVGNGSALNSLNATQISSGTLPLAQLPPAVVTNNMTGVTLSGTFTGNGAAVTNVNAAALNGSNATNFWQLGGNNVASGQFLGSTNNQPLEMRVNGGRALRLEPGGASAYVGNGIPTGAPNVIGGSPLNYVGAGVVGAVIGGGGATNYSFSSFTNSVAADFGTIGGGVNNSIQPVAYASFLGGGANNSIQMNGFYSFLGGGAGNSIQTNASISFLGGGAYNSVQPNATYSFLGGGFENFIGTNATYSVLGGGYSNSIGMNAQCASVLGGVKNFAAGNYSFAAGDDAQALHNGAFVWADSQGTAFASTAANEFLIRAGGGVGINNNNPGGASLSVSGSTVFSPGSGTLTITNDGGIVPGIVASGGGASGHARFRNALEIWPNTALTSGGFLDVRNTSGVPTITAYGQNGEIDARNTIGNPTVGLYGQNGDIVTYNPANNSTFILQGNYGLMALANTNGTATINLDGNVGQIVCVTLSQTSDRNAKEHFQPVSVQEVLAKVAALPVSRWNYKQDAASEHIGPMAQDFYAAFNVGNDDKHITTVDEGGVALAAIQGLNEKLETRSQNAEFSIRELQAETEAKDAEIQELKQRLAALEKIILHQKSN